MLTLFSQDAFRYARKIAVSIPVLGGIIEYRKADGNTDIAVGCQVCRRLYDLVAVGGDNGGRIAVFF